MPKVLIVTNDFPPRAGGIQSFIHALATRLPAGRRGGVRARLGGRGRVRPAAAVPGAAPSHLADAPGAHGAGPRGPRADRARLRQGAVRRGRAARPAGACAARGPAPGGSSRSPTATRPAGPRCPARAACCAGSATRCDVVTYLGEYFRVRLARALSPAAAARMARLAPGRGHRRVPARRRRGRDPGPARPGRPAGGGLRVPAGAPQGPGHAASAPGPRSAAGAAIAALLLVGGGPAAGGCGGWPSELGVAGLGAVHRPGARGGAARLLRRRGRVRDAVPDPAPRPGRRGPRHRLPGGVGHRAAGGRRATPAARRTPCSAARPATWCPAATWPRSPTGSASCSPTRRARRAMGEKGLAWVDREWRWDLVGAAAGADLLLADARAALGRGLGVERRRCRRRSPWPPRPGVTLSDGVR